MTSHSMSFGRPQRASFFSPALLLGQVTAWTLKSLRRLDRWQLGGLHQEQPQTAQDVLDWADRLQPHDPGFASDLRAAAMRSMDERGA